MEYDLDIKDAFILTYLKEISFLKNVIEKRIDGKRYIWIDYQKLITYLPILKISSEEVIGRRMSKYEKLGLIKRHLHRNMSYGTYTFFYLNECFSTLFEISKSKYEDKEVENMKKKMGLSSSDSTFQSGGFDSKVESQSTQRSAHNTPKHDTPINNSSSTPAAASNDNFEKELKNILPNFTIKNLNKNSIKNIKKYSNGNIDQVKKVIHFMKLKNKSMTSNILVAILRDGDHKESSSVDPQKIKRQEKINFMINKLGDQKVKSIRNLIVKEIGFEGEHVDMEVGNILCKKFNQYIEKGGNYV